MVGDVFRGRMRDFEVGGGFWLGEGRVERRGGFRVVGLVRFGGDFGCLYFRVLAVGVSKRIFGFCEKSGRFIFVFRLKRFYTGSIEFVFRVL